MLDWGVADCAATEPAPTLLYARTWKVYCVPLVKLRMVWLVVVVVRLAVVGQACAWVHVLDAVL